MLISVFGIASEYPDVAVSWPVGNPAINSASPVSSTGDKPALIAATELVFVSTPITL
jgi:hypothetical protein